MHKLEVFENILSWEAFSGESFFDYFDSSLNTIAIMFWLKGKGLVTKENFNKWEEDYSKNELDANSAMYFLEINHENPYEILKSESIFEGTLIIAEFISESTTYLKRFELFLEENK